MPRSKSKFAKRYPAQSHKQSVANRAGGHGDQDLTSTERAELVRLRRENKQLRAEREILGEAAAWFAKAAGPGTKRSSDS